MTWVDEDADLGWLINRRVREYDLGQRSEHAEVLGERKLGHHLDCAAAMWTCVRASFDHLPDAADDVVKSLPRPLCRYGSRSSAAAVASHPARVWGAAVVLCDLGRLAVEPTQRHLLALPARARNPPSYKGGGAFGGAFLSTKCDIHVVHS